MPLCRSCGEEVSATNAFCTYCGQAQKPIQGAPSFRTLDDSVGIRMLVPVGRSGWAMASGYLALFSLLILPAPFALVTGLLAVRDIQRDAGKHGMGRAVFGIIMGVLGTTLLLLTFTKRF